MKYPKQTVTSFAAPPSFGLTMITAEMGSINITNTLKSIHRVTISQRLYVAVHPDIFEQTI